MHYLDNLNFNNDNIKIRDVEARGLIQDNTNAINSVKAKADKNEKDIKALDDRLTAAEEDIDNHEGRLDVAESDIDNLETHMDKAEADIKSLRSDLTQAEKDINDLEDRMDQAESDINSLAERLSDAEDNIEDLTEDLTNYKESNDNWQKEQDNRLDDIEAKDDEQDKRLDDHDKLISDIEDKNKEQDKELDSLDKRITASTYEAGVGIYFGQGIDHTSINVEDELLDEIHASTEKNIEQDARLDAIEAKDIEQDKRLDAIEKKDAEQDKRLDSIETKDKEQDGRLDSLENRMTSNETKDNEQDSKISSLESTSQDHEERITQLETEVDSLDSRVETIEDTLDDLKVPVDLGTISILDPVLPTLNETKGTLIDTSKFITVNDLFSKMSSANNVFYGTILYLSNPINVVFDICNFAKNTITLHATFTYNTTNMASNVYKFDLYLITSSWQSDYTNFISCSGYQTAIKANDNDYSTYKTLKIGDGLVVEDNVLKTNISSSSELPILYINLSIDDGGEYVLDKSNQNDIIDELNNRKSTNKISKIIKVKLYNYIFDIYSITNNDIIIKNPYTMVTNTAALNYIINKLNYDIISIGIYSSSLDIYNTDRYRSFYFKLNSSFDPNRAYNNELDMVSIDDETTNEDDLLKTLEQYRGNNRYAIVSSNWYIMYKKSIYPVTLINREGYGSSDDIYFRVEIQSEDSYGDILNPNRPAARVIIKYNTIHSEFTVSSKYIS